ncbi:hypothetical protein FNF28_05325 [Cafeteria roenbergensis]|uniref:ADP-ribosylation factor-related protein 1 n=1 Tax=Cafeteria roenbergensis TaxID=33653 RepID=A0A5A8DA44_CAFRO|nr:hypothetical protein FNF28_05325 [Cafeteria roenbergensis]
MFSLAAALYEECTRKQEVRVPILGLANAGKTTLLEQAKSLFPSDLPPMPLRSIRPTIGMNIGRLTVDGAVLLAWDVGGQMESLWPSYYDGAHALVFVVDASDTATFPRVAEALARVLAHRAVSDRRVLLVANKQDLPGALSASAVREGVVAPAAAMAARGPPPVRGGGRSPSEESSAGPSPTAAPARAVAAAVPEAAEVAFAERVRTVEASALAGEGVKEAVRWLVGEAVKAAEEASAAAA